MVRKTLLLILVYGCCGNLLVSAQGLQDDSVSLQQCYQLALKRSYVLSEKEELVHQAEARIVQARSSFLPSINLGATHARQDVDRSTGLSTSPSGATTTYLNGNQSIFKGFKDFALLKQRKLERSSYQEALHEAKIQLFDDVASAFFTIMRDQKAIVNFNNELNAYYKRKNELVDLKSKGRVREADIVVVDVSIADLEAQMASTKGLLDVAYEALDFLTGFGDEIVLRDTSPDSIAIGELDDWTKGLDKSPVILQAMRKLEAAQQELKGARSGYWPSVDVDGNRYIRRDGVNANVDWDVLLSVRMPLFSGGQTQAQVKESASKVKQQQNALEKTRQEYLRDVRSQYKVVQADLEQIKKLGQSLELSQRYFDLLLNDNRQGLATNIDVINALAEVHRKKRASDQALMASKYDFVKLQVIAAQLNLF